MYTVYCNAPFGILRNWPYSKNYFPRKFYYIVDARKIAREIRLMGATDIKVVRKDGKVIEWNIN